MLNILILSALPQEHRHLRKSTPRWRHAAATPFKTYGLDLSDRKIVLVETGMGSRVAAQALDGALARFRPDLVIFAGFCGGLHPDLSVGDLCVAHKSLTIHPAAQLENDVFTFVFPDELREFFRKWNVKPVTAATIEAPEEKATLAAVVGDGPAAADMESAPICAIALREGLPLLILRSVSDAVNDDLGFSLEQITGQGGRVAVLKVLGTVLANPWVLKAFYLAWRRSEKAGKRLGAALADFLMLPGGSLGRIARQIRVRSGSGETGPRPDRRSEDF
jgi:adenosylhomocysteine nucleosidase